MNNACHTTASREEEIAFLIVEEVLGVEVRLADAGGGDKVPDGRWEKAALVAVIEVTSPPSTEPMRAFAEVERARKAFHETTCSPLHLGNLAEHLTELVTQTLAKDIEKLNGAVADERHLFLFGRAGSDLECFARLSAQHDDNSYEPVNDPELPQKVTDVWFHGRARRKDDPIDGFTVWVARFNRTHGWARYQVDINEHDLPSPTIVVDPAPEGWRSPASRR